MYEQRRLEYIAGGCSTDLAARLAAEDASVPSTFPLAPELPACTCQRIAVDPKNCPQHGWMFAD